MKLDPPNLPRLKHQFQFTDVDILDLPVPSFHGQTIWRTRVTPSGSLLKLSTNLGNGGPEDGRHTRTLV